MVLSSLDLFIIGLYLASTIGIGLYLHRRASQNLDAYFLGGKTLPWYLLGLSNASGMFDVSGTMWMVYLAFVYGVKSAWVPWLWPVFNQVFLMCYMSVWLRRSNVLTGAAWIGTRFGHGPDGRLSHLVVVAFALLGVLGFLSYGFVGIGKFMEIFIPWSAVAPYVPFEVAPAFVPHLYGIFFTSIATLYVVLGGMLSVVWTDVLQFSIMTVAAIAIAIIAMQAVDLDVLESMVPAGWMDPFFGWEMGLDWSSKLSLAHDKMAQDGYDPFGLFFMLMAFKGLFASMAGPAPNYDMQKILSTRSPREAAKMSGAVSAILLLPRYLMIFGFAVLAVVFFSDDISSSSGHFDFESILPMAILEFVPSGLRGLLLAGLLAAFVSTFASTVNAAPAYLVNDVYLKYINPKASDKQQISMSYLTSVLMVTFSILIGLYVQNINSILQWIVSGLYGGYIAANALKWHWWRFNGYGFFWGMTTGIASALSMPLLFGGTLELYYFPLLFLLSLAGSVAGSLLTRPTDRQVLRDFYRTVKPWGFWAPIQAEVQAEFPAFQPNGNLGRDWANILTGIVWQMALTITPIYLVLQDGLPFGISLGVLLLSSWLLKRHWYDRLAPEDAAYEAEQQAWKELQAQRAEQTQHQEA